MTFQKALKIHPHLPPPQAGPCMNCLFNYLLNETANCGNRVQLQLKNNQQKVIIHHY